MKIACPKCSSKEFVYRESYPVERKMARNAGGTLTFYSDVEWDAGDDDPGVVCASCETPLDIQDVKVKVSWT